MKSRTFICAAMLASAASAIAAPTGKVFSSVYSFPSGPGGQGPNGKLLSQGVALYGTTYYGGNSNAGTIYQLAPAPGGITLETVLYTFSGGIDGGNPTAGLIADSNGALYGTASTGGSGGGGVVFQLSRPGRGGTTWTYTPIYSFGGAGDGANPNCDLAFDSNSKLYGTTVNGGASGKGTVFQLDPPTDGTSAWTENILYSFNGTSGAQPYSNIVVGPTGNLFGTTSAGGIYHYGTAFELIPPTTPGNPYIHLILHEFAGNSTGASDGKYPLAGVVVSANGVVYGNTYGGGTGSGGIVYRLDPPSSGIVYTETVLFNFDGTNGANPSDVLTPDAQGNLYGTTGGAALGTAGNVFVLLTPANPGDPYTLSELYAFTGGTDGQAPLASLITTGSGTLYGTTFYGGNWGSGTVFQLK